MSAEDETAYDVWDNAYRVRIKDHGDHIAVMSFDTVADRFLRVNISRADFERIVANVPVAASSSTPTGDA